MQNLFDLLTSYAFVGILALGLLVVLIAGGIDISFTATASVAQYVTLSLANAYGANWIGVFAIAIELAVRSVPSTRFSSRNFEYHRSSFRSRR